MNTVHAQTIWNPETAPDTFEQHNRICSLKGSVYWGVIFPDGYPYGQIEKDCISAINNQLKNKIQTYIFMECLNTKGEKFCGEILEIETFAFSWECNFLVPNYYKKTCSTSQTIIWFRIKNFTSITSDILDYVRPCITNDLETYRPFAGWPLICPCNFKAFDLLENHIKTGGSKPRHKYPNFHQSPDLTYVSNNGKEYNLTTMQGKAVKYIFEKMVQGNNSAPQSEILKSIGSQSTQLRNIFKPDKSGAWGKLIVKASDSKDGKYRLNLPPNA